MFICAVIVLRMVTAGAGPSGSRGWATPLGAALHPCTRGSPEPSAALPSRAPVGNSSFAVGFNVSANVE